MEKDEKRHDVAPSKLFLLFQRIHSSGHCEERESITESLDDRATDRGGARKGAGATCFSPQRSEGSSKKPRALRDDNSVPASRQQEPPWLVPSYHGHEGSTAKPSP